MSFKGDLSGLRKNLNKVRQLISNIKARYENILYRLEEMLTESPSPESFDRLTDKEFKKGFIALLDYLDKTIKISDVIDKSLYQIRPKISMRYIESFRSYESAFHVCFLRLCQAGIDKRKHLMDIHADMEKLPARIDDLDMLLEDLLALVNAGDLEKKRVIVALPKSISNAIKDTRTEIILDTNFFDMLQKDFGNVDDYLIDFKGLKVVIPRIVQSEITYNRFQRFLGLINNLEFIPIYPTESELRQIRYLFNQVKCKPYHNENERGDQAILAYAIRKINRKERLIILSRDPDIYRTIRSGMNELMENGELATAIPLSELDVMVS